jgi:hypothetical protein
MRNPFGTRAGGDAAGGDITGATTEAIAKWMAQHGDHLAHIVVHHGRSRLGRIAIEDIHPGREVEDVLLDDPRFGAGTYRLKGRDRKDMPLSGSVSVSVGRETKRVEKDAKRELVAAQPDAVEQIANVTGMLKDMGVFNGGGGPGGGGGGMDAVTAAILPEMFRTLQGNQADPFAQARGAMAFVVQVSGARQAEQHAQFGAHSDVYEDEDDDEYEDDGDDLKASNGYELMGALGGRFL